MTTRIRVVEIETDEPGALSEALRPTVVVTPALPAPVPEVEPEADEGGGDMADATRSAAVVERPSSPAASSPRAAQGLSDAGDGAAANGRSAPPANGRGSVRQAPLLKCGKRHWPNSREHRIGCMGETPREEPSPARGAVAGETGERGAQLRPCPRCEKGQLIVTNHGAGVERECLQCGYTDNGLTTAPVAEDVTDERSRKRQPSSGGMRL